MTSKNTVVDEMGVWEILGNGGKDLLEPSAEWIARQKELSNEATPVEPSQEERIAALEQALLDILLG